MAKTNSKTALSEQVKSYLLSRYARGEESWNEEKLARRFHVSRTPIRDVLYELEKQRIITRQHKRGIILRKPSAKEIAEVYDVRVALEKLAIARAVNRFTVNDIETLRQIDRDIVKSVKANDISLTDQLDMKFHMKLIEISGNEYLKTIIDQFHLLIRSFQIGGRLHNLQEPVVNPGHEGIIDALERRDRRTCLKLIRLHISGAKKVLLRQVIH
jgi:DNA-binding GntR family transcriptional regulator